MPAPRAVPDPNVLVAAAIAPRGICGRLLDAAIDGRWKPVVSPQLMAELDEVLARRKFRNWLTLEDARQITRELHELSDIVPDPDPPLPAARRCADPDDEYLLTLASAAPNLAALISGDHHLTALTDLDPPVITPAAFLARLPEG